MGYAAAEKLEIVQAGRASRHCREVRTLDLLGIPRSTLLLRWYDRCSSRARGRSLQDRSPAPRRCGRQTPRCRSPDAVLSLALKEPELSPRELAVSFVDQRQYFVSEASVYRLLKAHDLITSPAFILMKAADSFAHPTTAPNQLWQTDFTYLRVIGWGWYYLSTVLDDFSRYILAWKLCTSMTATDVSDTLAIALRSSGLERVRVRHRPRLLSDNGPSYLSAQLGSWLAEHGMTHTRGKPYHPMTQGKIERYHRSMKNQILLENYYLPGHLEQRLTEFVDYYAPAALSREPQATSPRPMSASVVVKPFWHGGKLSSSGKPSNYDAGCIGHLKSQLQLRWTKFSLDSIVNLSERF